MKSIEEFKDFYRETLGNKGISQYAEARALGMSQAMVSNYMSHDTSYSLGIHQISKSLVKQELLEWLAADCDCSFVPHPKHLNGKITDELATILQCTGRILRNPADMDTVKGQTAQMERAVESMKSEVEKRASDLEG